MILEQRRHRPCAMFASMEMECFCGMFLGKQIGAGYNSYEVAAKSVLTGHLWV
jgi:hypothetical protein